MKRKFLLLTVLVMSLTRVWCQTPVGGFELNFEFIKSLQGIPYGTNLFFSFEDHLTTREKIHRFFMLRESGELKEIFLDEIPAGRNVCGVFDDGKLLYIAGQNATDFVVQSLVFDAAGKKTLSEKKIAIQGQLLGAFEKNGYCLVSLNKESGIVYITRITAENMIDQKKYPLPVSLFSAKGENYVFAPLENNLPLNVGEARVKIFRTEGELIIIKDELPSKDKPKGETIIVTVNLATAQAVVNRYPAPTEAKFRSTISGSYLFRVIAKDRLQVFDLNTSGLVKESFLENYKIATYSRVEAGLATSEMAGNFPQGNVITANRIDDGTFFITIGTAYSNDFVPELVNPLGVSLPVVTFSEDNDRFTYRNFPFSIEQGIRDSGPGSLWQQVDEYEMKQQKAGIKYKFKGYLTADTYIIAFYQEKKEYEVKIVKFGRPGTR